MSYAEAMFPDRWRCAGIPLATHTLGHALLLQRLGNRFAGRPRQEPAEGHLGQLLQALLVCSRPWAKAFRLIDTRRERIWMGWHSRRAQHPDIETTTGQLQAYLAAAWPEINWWAPADGKGRTLGADLLQILVGHQRRTGLSISQALDVPLAVAHWDAAAAAERSGVITIRSRRDEVLSEHYDRLMAEGALPAPGTVIDRN